MVCSNTTNTRSKQSRRTEAKSGESMKSFVSSSSARSCASSWGACAGAAAAAAASAFATDVEELGRAEEEGTAGEEPDMEPDTDEEEGIAPACTSTSRSSAGLVGNSEVRKLERSITHARIQETFGATSRQRSSRYYPAAARPLTLIGAFLVYRQPRTSPGWVRTLRVCVLP